MTLETILPVILMVVFVILGVVLSAVGIQLFLVLFQVRKTLTKLTALIDNAEKSMHALANPLHQLGGIATGLKTGLRVVDLFVQWLNKDKK